MVTRWAMASKAPTNPAAATSKEAMRSGRAELRLVIVVILATLISLVGSGSAEDQIGDKLCHQCALRSEDGTARHGVERPLQPPELATVSHNVDVEPDRGLCTAA